MTNSSKIYVSYDKVICHVYQREIFQKLYPNSCFQQNMRQKWHITMGCEFWVIFFQFFVFHTDRLFSL